LKLYFEAFKQMTTLTAAVAVVIISLSEWVGTPDKALETTITFATIGSLRISLAISLQGMQAVTRYMQDWWPGAAYKLSRRLASANVFFAAGILGFAWNSILLLLGS
jgi:hypothetical protein